MSSGSCAYFENSFLPWKATRKLVFSVAYDQCDYIYVYIYIYIYIHTHIHTYIHTYIHTDKHMSKTIIFGLAAFQVLGYLKSVIRAPVWDSGFTSLRNAQNNRKVSQMVSISTSVNIPMQNQNNKDERPTNSTHSMTTLTSPLQAARCVYSARTLAANHS
jgi:hypothetical protein